MTMVERVKKLPTPMFIVFVASKALVGLGLGVLLARYLHAVGWLILGLGIALSVIAAAKVLNLK